MFKQATDSRVAVLFAPGLEEIEGLTVVDLLYRAGIPCDTVAVTPEHEVTSSHEVTVVCKRSIADEGFSFGDYDMLVLPGGIPGTPNLRACQPLCDEVVARAQAGRPLAAICAAPSILGELGVLEGHRATCFPGFEDTFPAGVFAGPKSVVVDGNIITASAMGQALPFALAVLGDIAGDVAVEKVREGIQL